MQGTTLNTVKAMSSVHNPGCRQTTDTPDTEGQLESMEISLCVRVCHKPCYFLLFIIVCFKNERQLDASSIDEFFNISVWVQSERGTSLSFIFEG